MTWRERTEAARERGGYTPDDLQRVGYFETCLVGEALKHAGLPTFTKIRHTGDIAHGQLITNTLYRLGLKAAYLMGHRYAPAHVDALHDQIEDEVLRLKREGLVTTS